MQEWEVADEHVLVAEEARRTRELHRSIGYKRGLAEARQGATVQRGFDDGFQRAALIAFCRAYTVQDPTLRPVFEEVASADGLVGGTTHVALLALYEDIKSRLVDPST